MRLKLVCLVFCLVSLSACGGGGGEATPNDPPKSSNANLSALEPSDGTLSPAFSTETTGYSLALPYAVTEISFVVTASDNRASLIVEGISIQNGGSTSPISLNVGVTAVEIVVTAEDGTTKRTYSVDVSRDTASADATAKSIDISPGGLEPAFNESTSAYSSVVGYLQTFVEFEVGTHPGATVTVNGDPLTDSFAVQRFSLIEGDNNFVLSIIAEDGATTTEYTVDIARRSADTFGPIAYFKASNPDPDDYFGRSMTNADDYIVVGAGGEDSFSTGINGDQFADNGAFSTGMGAAYVFEEIAENAFEQTTYVKASNTDEGDVFGVSIASAGNIVAIGAAFEESGSPGIGADQSDNSVRQSGAVYVFEKNEEEAWVQEAYIKSPAPIFREGFGIDLAMSGNTLVVGASEEIRDNGLGSVFVYDRSEEGVWSLTAELISSNRDPHDAFGNSLDIDGNIIVVGAKLEDSASNEVNGDESDNSESTAGAAYVFVKDHEGNWSQEAYLKGSNTENVADHGDAFGWAVSVSGTSIAVSAHEEDSAATGINGDQTDNRAFGAGAVYIFSRSNEGTWSQEAYVKPSDTQPINGNFGYNIALQGDVLVVIARRHPEGQLYVFERDRQSGWTERIKVTPPDRMLGNDPVFFSLYGDTLVWGASQEDSSAVGVNGDPYQGDSYDSGAAYVYR